MGIGEQFEFEKTGRIDPEPNVVEHTKELLYKERILIYNLLVESGSKYLRMGQEDIGRHRLNLANYIMLAEPSLGKDHGLEES